MQGCCSAFQSAGDQQFNQRKVALELKRYREKGPGPTTRLLADGIAQSGALSGGVLDVGSGIGALTLALLERGAPSAIAVDASTAYVSVAREEAGRPRANERHQVRPRRFRRARTPAPICECRGARSRGLLLPLVGAPPRRGTRTCRAVSRTVLSTRHMVRTSGNGA